MTPLESGPHGIVHVTIGGDMSDMGSPNDPIFWLHHCNIDRLWAWWNALGRHNTTNRLWTTFQFNGIFQTPQGQGVTAWNVGVSDMLDHQAWGYTYPDLPGNPALPPIPGPQADPNLPANVGPPASGDQVASAADVEPPQQRVLAAEAGKGSVRLNTVLSTRLNLQEILKETPLRPESRAPARNPEAAGGPAPGRKDADPNAILRETPLGPASGTPAPAPAPTPTPVAGGGAAGGPAVATASLPEGRVFSVFENIKASGANAVRVNVFLNHPNPTAATSTDDPHFVGTFGLFGLQSHAAHGGISVQLELTKTIASLRRANIAIGKQLDVQLIPVEARGNSLELKSPDRVKIFTM
jgi:hypothetical protein